MMATVPAHDTADMQLSRTLYKLIPLVTDAVESPHTRRVYQQQLERFFQWCAQQPGEVFGKALVQRYLAFLRTNGKGAATRNQALTAVRKLANEAADNRLMDEADAHAITNIPAAKRRGVRTGNWLSEEQGRALLKSPDVSTLKGKRDRAVLALLLECGLRRDEAANVEVHQLCKRENRWVLADLTGKGGKVRTVPVGWRAAEKIQDWIDAANITEGRILRPVRSERVDGDTLSTTSVYKIVLECAEPLGLDIKPHDLRRTFSKLVDDAGAPLEQIQATLGHSSVSTTERYLGKRQNLKASPCDTIDIEGDD